MITPADVAHEASWAVVMTFAGALTAGILIGLMLYPRLVPQGRHSATGVAAARVDDGRTRRRRRSGGARKGPVG